MIGNRCVSLCATLFLTCSISLVCAADSEQEIGDIREEIRVLQQRLDELERQIVVESAPKDADEAWAEEESSEDAPAAPPEAVVAETTEDETGSAGRALLLPDISLIGMFGSHASSDSRDVSRGRVSLDVIELGVQSYVYPSIKADAFIVMPADHDHHALVEEGYLTVSGLAPNLGIRVGKTKVPFGRVNQLHMHSWLYVTQAAALANLVGPESLAGEGIAASYLLPAGRRFFARVDGGIWNGGGHHTHFEDPLSTDGVHRGPGAAFDDRFATLRLWTSMAPSADSEIEIGASHAWGAGAAPLPDTPNPRVKLSGGDITYRRYGGSNQRSLLRAEWYQHHNDHPSLAGSAKGYYILADQRLSAYREYALRYDWSEYPYNAHLHESALSAILTSQMTEQTYLRLQLTHGSRPGETSYNEAWLQWVWGVGPHTHELE